MWLSNVFQRRKEKKELIAEILRIASSGVLSESAATTLTTRYKQIGLKPSDLNGVRAQAYSAMLRAVKSDGVINAAEEAQLDKLETFLRIPPAEIASEKRELRRLRTLAEIQSGNPPIINTPNVILQKGEVAYWAEPATLLEERVVGRRYEGGSQGVSFRIMKGVTYRVGAHRGNIVIDRAVVPVSSGELIVTSKRVVFRGDRKSINLRLDKLLEVQLYSDGFRFSDDKGKPHLLQFTTPGNSDVIGATLSFAINRFAQ